VADQPADAGARGVCAVVVTYDDRWQYLEPTLEGVLSQAVVTRLVVVDNGASPRVGERLAEVARRDARLAIVRHTENLGSAGGFRTGLEAAATTSAGFVWTLDDDTRPEAGAAAALVEAWNGLAAAGDTPVRALLSQRWDTARYRREAEWSVNAAFGVDLIQRATRVGRAVEGAAGSADTVIVRMAPWSGLFFERSRLEEVAPPDSRLVLYEDDHDFTLRLTAGRGGIMLVPQSRLVTLQTSWQETTRSRGLLTPWLTTPDVRRAYYCARNRVYVERQRLVTNRVRYAINLAVFTTRVAVAGLITGSFANTRWFLAGVFDGWRGRLGPRSLPPQEKPSSPFTG